MTPIRLLRRTFPVLLAFSMLTLTYVSASAQETYPIRFSRPMEVGDQYRQASQASESQKISLSAGGNALQNRDETVEVVFESRVRVDAVNEDGSPTKVSHVIDKFEKAIGTQKAVMLSPGDVVVATSQGDRVIFMVNDLPVAADLEKLLTMTITVDTGQPTEEDLFGTDQPRKVGETWAMSADLAATTMERMQVKIDPKNVTGEGKLDEVKVRGDDTLVRMSGRMTLKNLEPAGLQGMTMTESDATMTYSTLAPADTTKPTLEETKAYDLNFTANGKQSPQSPEMTLSVKVSRKTHSTFEHE